jgi:hypothetical protein
MSRFGNGSWAWAGCPHRQVAASAVTASLENIMASSSLALNQLPSWPGLSRPSTPSFIAKQGVDARDKRGHDGGD